MHSTVGGLTTTSIVHGQRSQPTIVIYTLTHGSRPLRLCCKLPVPLQVPNNPLSSIGILMTSPPNILSFFTSSTSSNHRLADVSSIYLTMDSCCAKNHSSRIRNIWQTLHTRLRVLMIIMCHLRLLKNSTFPPQLNAIELYTTGSVIWVSTYDGDGNYFASS